MASRKAKFERLERRDLLSGDGLLGQYFDSPNLTGLADQRIDTQIQFPADFTVAAPDIGAAPAGTTVQPDDNWSVRWTGHVRIDSPGDWTFHTDSDDGVRLWVNGQQIIDNWTVHGLVRDSGSLTLDPGWYPIQMEFFQSGTQSTGNRAAIRLSYEGPDQPETVIPQSNLSSNLLTSVDIGNVGGAGSLAIDHELGRYTVRGSGADIQGTADGFHFAYLMLDGDGAIQARVNSIVNTNPFAKGGLMFRESLDPSSRNAMMEMKATTGSEFQYRSENGGGTTVGTRDGNIDPPYWVRIERFGDTFRGLMSADGINWELQDTALISMPDEVFVGLAVTSHNNNATTTAVFEQVSITNAAAPPDGPTIPGTQVDGFIPLLTEETFDPLTDDGQDPEGFVADDDEFYTFRGPRFGVNHPGGHDEDEGKSAADEDVVFRLNEAGELHILGIPDTGQSEPFGYISTEDHYRNYHLTLEYKWGPEKFSPRNNQKRDSGLLYHAVGPDVVWTTDVETQIQEGDTGDFFFLGENPNAAPGSLGSSEGTVTVNAAGDRYEPGGETLDTGGGLTKLKTVDSLTDWNRVEVILERDNVTVIVNGVVVNRATNLRRVQDGLIIPLKEGKIALQAEGAEIFYRNVGFKPTHAVGGRGEFRVLVFQEHGDGVTPEVVAAAHSAIERLGASNDFTVDVANDSDGVFTDANLREYAAVVWNGASGESLDAAERAAFERYIRAGGGYVGLHEAAAGEHDWGWYEELVGATASDLSTPQLANVRIDSEAFIGSGGVEMNHPAVDALPQAWQRVDAWTEYETNPRAQVNVLLNLEELPDAGPGDHPISWWQTYDGGRSFFSGLGYRTIAYHEPLYLAHLLGGIEYAAGVSRVAPDGATVLFDGTNTGAFEKRGGGLPGWQIDDESSLAIVPGSGSIQTVEAFSDYRLHLEFQTPATPPGVSEQRRGNSGLYLHSSYELQLLDSYGDPNFDNRHLGSIYDTKEADRNAALPAETWQVYDVDFTAPKFDSLGAKVANARITAYLNGVLIHDDVEVTAPTNGGATEQAGPQPFWLQDHDSRSNLRFRNIWLLPAAEPPALAGDFNRDGNVDSADYTVWRDAIDTAVAAYSGPDADGDGFVTQADRQVWISNYGATSVTANSVSGADTATSSTSARSSTDDPVVSPPASSTSSNRSSVPRQATVAANGFADGKQELLLINPNSLRRTTTDAPSDSDDHRRSYTGEVDNDWRLAWMFADESDTETASAP